LQARGTEAATDSSAAGTSAPAPGDGSDAAATETPPGPRTRLRDGIHKPKVYTDDTVRYGCFTASGEPQSLDEALNSRDWKLAMDAEYNALIDNKTWHLVPPKRVSMSLTVNGYIKSNGNLMGVWIDT
jgi:hypothetical protein